MKMKKNRKTKYKDKNVSQHSYSKNLILHQKQLEHLASARKSSCKRRRVRQTENIRLLSWLEGKLRTIDIIPYTEDKETLKTLVANYWQYGTSSCLDEVISIKIPSLYYKIFNFP